ncbi:serine--tRNA ligase [bacterium]|nr:serine--tRNA ligase [candidate division CSSED10-310 bacterium]
MLDIKLIRHDTESLRKKLERLHCETPLDLILERDARRRDLLVKVEELKSERNRVSKEISREADSSHREMRIAEMRDVGDAIAQYDMEIRALDASLNDAMLRMPNVPHESAPDGLSEADNVVIRNTGVQRSFDFEPKPHWELAERLGIIDFERGVKISGTRFYILKGQGARLQRALIAFMLDQHVKCHGYTEIYPPYMVRSECMIGTGQLPKFGDNLYRDAEDDFMLIPTAEVPVTNMHAGEIFDKEQLPLRYVAYSACFRREKMSAGRDVRGIKRGHQFDKVEMVTFVDPAESYDELESLLRDAESICADLGLPYRVLNICTADLSFTAAKKYDIEVWAPGCNEWLEVSSCSNFEAFQARRTQIRFRPEPKAKPQFVHTLNGSGLGLPRTLIAVLENGQEADGSVTLPDALVPYMGGLKRLEPH